MKKILLDSSKPFYKANMHCHSTYSDGAMTVEELKARYMEKGYSIIAFTDHEHLIDQSHLTDEHFLALTSCEIAIKQYPELSTLKRFSMKVCHLNFYAKDPHNVDTPCYNSVADHFIKDFYRDKIVHSCGEYERVYSHEGISDMIRIANEKGFLVAYNHPHWSLENACDYLGYKGLFAVEIHNSACVCEGIYEYSSHVYDDFLRDGQMIACVAGDDTHAKEHMFGGYTAINADALDYASVIRALEEHRFYATTGPVIRHLEIEDMTARITYEKGAFVTMQTKGRRAQRMMAEHEGENTAVFTLRENDGYVRFDVVGADGTRANTNAYLI